ncbi:putative HTH-type transcriptional regulator [Methylobacterium bullatum]|uniref:Putative HTH-type transcriptional regulator n=1 Tax=Methylobacterium bullatum TaxID=570505 RepID=A0A679IRU4_9HYPH|nr:putative HTH-type transcriptional regulator [Methylobacterium bullatum]
MTERFGQLEGEVVAGGGDVPTSDRTGARNPAETDKRRQILDGARSVFMASGFDGASMGEIAKAAGVSKGTLYVYFDSKEALFEALTLEEKRGLAEALFQLDADDPDVRGVLTRLGETYLVHMIRPDHVAIIRMVIGATEKFPRFGQAFYEAGPAQGVARLTAYLDRQVAAGRLRRADTELAAKHFLHLCQAGLLTRLLFAAGGPVTQGEIAPRVSEAIRVFFAAYGPED